MFGQIGPKKFGQWFDLPRPVDRIFFTVLNINDAVKFGLEIGLFGLKIGLFGLKIGLFGLKIGLYGLEIGLFGLLILAPNRSNLVPRWSNSVRRLWKFKTQCKIATWTDKIKMKTLFNSLFSCFLLLCRNCGHTGT